MRPRSLFPALGILLLTSPLFAAHLSVTKVHFVAVTVSNMQSSGQKTQVLKEEVMWIAADGRDRLEEYDGTGKLTAVSIYNPASQDVYVLHPAEKMAAHFRVPDEQTFQQQFGALPNSTIFPHPVVPPVRFSGQNRTFLGTREIAGLTCRGNILPGDSGARMEGWGCPDPATGQVILASIHVTLPNGIDFRQDLKSIERNVDVDSSIFEVPPDYRVVEGAQ